MFLRKFVMVILLISSAMVAFGQGKIDTLYYDKNWMGAPNHLFAEYVVYTYESDNPLYANRYRSFYSTGQMESEGEFIHIDPYNARNNVYNNERTVYAKNGDVLQSLNYKNGCLDGLCVFKNKDNTMDYVDYKEGGYATSYILRQYPNGVCLKYNPETGNIIKDVPTESDRQVVTQDGSLWEFYNMNGVTVAANAVIIKEYGKYVKLSVIVANHTPNSFDFGVNNVTSVKVDFYNKDWDHRGVDYGIVLDDRQYESRIETRQILTEIALGVTAGLSASMTNYNNSIETHVYTNYGNAYITTTYFDNAAYQQQLNMNTILLMSQSMQHKQDLQRLQVGYLRQNTVLPNCELSGFVMIPYDFYPTGKNIIMNAGVEVDGVEYVFGFQWER